MLFVAQWSGKGWISPLVVFVGGAILANALIPGDERGTRDALLGVAVAFFVMAVVNLAIAFRLNSVVMPGGRRWTSAHCFVYLPMQGYSLIALLISVGCFTAWTGASKVATALWVAATAASVAGGLVLATQRRRRLKRQPLGGGGPIGPGSQAAGAARILAGEIIETSIVIRPDQAAAGTVVRVTVEGRTVNCRIPPGVKDGTRLRLPAGIRGPGAGVLLRIRVSAEG